MLTLRFGLACTLVTAVACSDTQQPVCDNQGRVCNQDERDSGQDLGSVADAAMDGNLPDSGVMPDLGEDASALQDAGDDAGNDAAIDAEMTDADSADATSVDAGDDLGSDSGVDPNVYDTTGWAMKTRTLSDSASTGTPDSYFFDVDSGSPLSASITGGGSGTWSVNVYGGYSNQLYPCSGSSLCQVMLRPEDTTVIVTAVTTDIGSYTLTVQYAGAGLQ
ncbi:MAG: hypothetical protein R3E66_00070 [bacterium]